MTKVLAQVQHSANHALRSHTCICTQTASVGKNVLKIAPLGYKLNVVMFKVTFD